MAELTGSRRGRGKGTGAWEPARSRWPDCDRARGGRSATATTTTATMATADQATGARAHGAVALAWLGHTPGHGEGERGGRAGLAEPQPWQAVATPSAMRGEEERMERGRGRAHHGRVKGRVQHERRRQTLAGLEEGVGRRAAGGFW
jgi:hypothetical protein